MSDGETAIAAFFRLGAGPQGVFDHDEGPNTADGCISPDAASWTDEIHAEIIGKIMSDG